MDGVLGSSQHDSQCQVPCKPRAAIELTIKALGVRASEDCGDVHPPVGKQDRRK